MKKFILLFFTFIFTLNSIFGFEVFDNSGNSESYFSLDNHQVYLKSLQNESPLTIMVAGDLPTLRSYNFISCLNQYCYDFSLNDYMSSVGISNVSTEFVISANGNSKSIYFDYISPSFSLENSIIDSHNKLLKLYFSYSDDFNVDSVEIFKLDSSVSSGVISLGEVVSNSYDFELDEEGNMTLRFRVTDGAGNFEDFDFDFEVEDLFAPVLDDLYLTFENDFFKLEFSAKDPNLDRYEVIQNDLKLIGELSGTSVSENINLPFYSGEFDLILYDTFGNSNLKTFSLSSNFDIEHNSEFSNENEFLFDSDAESCSMISIDSRSYDEDFNNKRDEFSVDLDIHLNGEYKLIFECSDSSYREVFERIFYYDTKKPTVSNLSLDTTIDGFLMLSWTESNDLISDVEYKLYRDGKRIYKGSIEKYIDEDVIYSNEYEYSLEIYDEASNFVRSNSIIGSPNKVSVELSSSLNEDLKVIVDKFEFEVLSETDSETVVIVKNLGKEFFSEDIKNSIQLVKLTLVSGVNEIIISSIDDFDNKKTLRYFITYNKPIPEVPIIKPTTNLTLDSVTLDGIKDTTFKSIQNEITDKKIIINSSKSLSINDLNSEMDFKWIWFIGLAVLFIVCICLFVFNNYSLKNYINLVIGKKSKRNKFNKLRKDNHHHKRVGDNELNKHIGKIKYSRHSKKLDKSIEQIKINNLILKSKKKISDLDKKKFSDLDKEKFDFNISHKKPNDDYKMKAESVQIEQKKEELFKEERPSKGRDMEFRLKKKPSLFGFFKREKVESTQKEIEDENFLGYISKQRVIKSWNKTHLYKQSHYDNIAQKKLDELKIVEQQKRMELEERQLAIDKQNNILIKKAKVDADNQEFDDNRKIARATMDDYLATKVSKRKSWFAEKLVSSDIKSRKK